MVEKEAPKKVEGIIEEPVAKKETPKAGIKGLLNVDGEDLVPPLTAEEFSTALDRLVERARTAGVQPFRVMIASYAMRGMSMIEGLLGGLDDKNNTPEKKA